MKVIVYSTNSCPFCNMVKDYLDQHNVKYEDFNVQMDHDKAKEMISKSGQTGVPVIDVDGNIVVGFDREKLKILLKLS